MPKLSLRYRMRCFIERDEFPYLARAAVDLNDVQEMKKVFNWQHDPLLIDDPALYAFHFVEDANHRKLRDAESLGVVARNAAHAHCLEIGTGRGYSTAMLATNAPAATIHTINIPPEDFAQGGVLTTMKLDRQEIGTYYRSRGLQNVDQIFANTATWEPQIGPLDMSFIDGSHDTDFVINDTLKVLKITRPGGFILWHDYNPALARLYPWVKTVCRGIDILLAEGVLRGRIFHLRDSWVGVYQVSL